MRFVVIARDAKDSDALSRRLKHREEHLKVGKEQAERDERLVGGPILNENGEMCGSVIVADFPDRGALDDWLKTEPYVTGHVWDDIEVLRCDAKLKEDR